MRDNMYEVPHRPCGTYESVRAFPRTRKGFTEAIKFASAFEAPVTFDGMIVWDGPHGARRGEAVRNRAILALEGRIEAGGAL